MGWLTDGMADWLEEATLSSFLAQILVLVIRIAVATLSSNVDLGPGLLHAILS